MLFPRWRLRLARTVPWTLFLAATVASARAQVTEAPETVAPGRFLLEMDALSLDHDRVGEAKSTALALATTLVSAGLTRTVDLQVGFQFFARTTYEDRAFHDTHAGIGDLTFRTKWTFWRDEGSGAAAAVIPYVKIPSNTGGIGNGSVEGGVIFPWAITLPGKVLTGAMLQWDILRNAANDGYDSRWYASAYAHRSFTRLLGLYAETTVSASSDSRSTFAGSLGGGVTLSVSENVVWDYEISRGVGSRATDWRHAIRLTWGF